MKITLKALLIGIATAAITVACAEENDAAKKDLAALQGEWTMLSGSADGQPMPEDMLKQMKRVCKGDETTTTINGQVFMKAKFSLNPTNNPKTIDYQMLEGFTKGKTQLGIYEVQGDKFKACFSQPGAERPTEFKAGEGITFSIWQRKSAAEPAQK
jgi:uncharacterized protein (TIGR03067 family)